MNDTDNQIATVEQSLVRIRVDNQQEQLDEMDEDNLEDLEDAEEAINEELEMLRASQDLIQELLLKLKKTDEEISEEASARMQGGSSVKVSFGAHSKNSGIQVGNNAGHMNFSGPLSFGTSDSRESTTVPR